MLHCFLTHVKHLEKKRCLRIHLHTVMFSSESFQVSGLILFLWTNCRLQVWMAEGEVRGVCGFLEWALQRSPKQEATVTTKLHIFASLHPSASSASKQIAQFKIEEGDRGDDHLIISSSSRWQNTFFLTGLIVKSKHLGVYGQNSEIASCLPDSFALALPHWWKSTPDCCHPHTFYKPCRAYYRAKVCR